MSRVSILDEQPELIDDLAVLFADGAKRADIAETFGVEVWTVTQWRKRPDVQRKVSKIVSERANRILSLTDTKLEALLHAKGASMSVDQLIKIRTAFAGENVNLNLQGDSATALRELMQAMHAEPELAAALSKLGFDGTEA